MFEKIFMGQRITNNFLKELIVLKDNIYVYV